jgi:acetyltransferase-like isoleucine patch superfamily enzyme
MLIKKVKIPFKKIATIGILPSFIKKTIYRAKGYKIGKNVSIGFGSVVIGKNVKIEDNVKIGLITIVRADEILIERFAAIGSFTVIDSGKIRIGEDARINEQVIIGGMKTPQSSFDLGKRTIVMEYSFINTTMPVTIGDDSGIGGHCLLFTHGSWLNQMEGFPVTFAPITIGKSVWLPWRVFVMPGVSIGDKVVVGANSLIAKSVAANSLIAGSPAKVIKENYPPTISNERKMEIFKSFLNDFVAYLDYSGIPTIQKGDIDSYQLKNDGGKTAFNMIAYFSYPIDGSISKNIDTLVVINIHETNNKLPTKVSENIMYIDIIKKERIGSSLVGEEFVKFLSRYGLRFARLD